MFHHVLVRASEYPTLAAGEAWPGLLGPREEAILASLAFPARRRKWLLGRAAAKRLVREMLGPPAPVEAAITVLNRPSGEPYVVLDEGPWALPISLSHRSEMGFAASPAIPGWRIGADVETIEPRDRALVRQFFTDEEARLVAEAGADADLVLTRIWSAKEAVLKLLGLGLRLDTRAVAVRLRGEPPPNCPDGWQPLGVTVPGVVPGQAPSHQLHVLWRSEGAHVLTVAVGQGVSAAH
jgi:4'-phosphopantetheinyl transferase